MARLSRALTTLALAAAAPFALAAMHGNWALIPQESNFGGQPSIKTAVVTIVGYSVHHDLVFRVDMVDADNTHLHLSFDAPQNGTPHPVLGLKGGTLTLYQGKSALLILPNGTREKFTWDYQGDRMIVNEAVQPAQGQSYQEKLVFHHLY